MSVYSYYGSGRVPALRFLYQMRYAVGVYDHAMRGTITPKIGAAKLPVPSPVSGRAATIRKPFKLLAVSANESKIVLPHVHATTGDKGDLG
jgi:hypothetical protein